MCTHAHLPARAACPAWLSLLCCLRLSQWGGKGRGHLRRGEGLTPKGSWSLKGTERGRVRPAITFVFDLTKSWFAVWSGGHKPSKHLLSTYCMQGMHTASLHESGRPGLFSSQSWAYAGTASSHFEGHSSIAGAGPHPTLPIVLGAVASLTVSTPISPLHQ